MKYKKKQLYLRARINWWESRTDDYKRACKKPGSIKVK